MRIQIGSSASLRCGSVRHFASALISKLDKQCSAAVMKWEALLDWRLSLAGDNGGVEGSMQPE